MQGQTRTCGAAPAKADEDFLLAPYFLVRTAGLPLNLLDQLECPRSMLLIDEILALESWLDTRRTPLLEALSEQYRQLPTQSLRNRCRDLQRAIAQEKGEKGRKLLQQSIADLPGWLQADLQAWCDACCWRVELLALGEKAFAEDMANYRESLQRIFQNDMFQRGLLLSSPTLYTELQHYLTASAHVNNNRLRRAEEGLLSYLVRMMTKPSPYSTFASTSFGSWQQEEEEESQLMSMDAQCWHQQSATRFHDGLLSAIVGKLAMRPEVRPYLRVTLNSTLEWLPSPAGEGKETTDSIFQSRLHAEKIACFVSRQEEELKPIYYREGVVRLRLNPLYRALLTTIEQSGATLTYQELRDRLVAASLPREGNRAQTLTTEQNGAQAHEPYTPEIYTEAEVTQVLEFLADREILHIGLHVPDHENDKLAYIIDLLGALPGAWVQRIREMFQNLHSLLKTYTSAFAAQRYELLTAMRQQMQAICDEIGSHPASEWDASPRIEKIFPSLLMEDTTRPFHNLMLQRAEWEDLLADLSFLQHVAPLLEGGLIGQMIEDCLIHERTMSSLKLSDTVIAYHTELSKVVAEARALNQPSRLAGIQLRAWAELRQTFIDMLLTQLQRTRESGSNILKLDQDEMRSFVQRFPTFLRQRYALAYFGQLFTEDGQRQMMVNLTWTGAGVAFSRFSYLLLHPESSPTFAEGFQAYLTELGRRHGVIYASVAETGGYNANIHGSLAPYEILFPRSVSLYPPEKQILLPDLQVFYNRDLCQTQLISQKLDTPVRPLHMGFSVIDVLSPFYQVLVAQNSHYPSFNLVALLEAHLSEEQRKQVRHYPRIQFGHAVLNREAWKIPKSEFPHRKTDETGFAYFLQMNRWRKALGLPAEGFYRLVSQAEQSTFFQERYLAQVLNSSPSSSAAEIDPQKRARQEIGATSERVSRPGTLQSVDPKLHKPFYVNFRSYPLLALFNTALRAIPEGQSLTFEEMLPSRQQAFFQQNSEEYASEFVIELGR